MKKVVYLFMFLFVFAMSSFSESNTLAVSATGSASLIHPCAGTWYPAVLWARDHGLNTQQAHSYADAQVAACYARSN